MSHSLGESSVLCPMSVEIRPTIRVSNSVFSILSPSLGLQEGMCHRVWAGSLDWTPAVRKRRPSGSIAQAHHSGILLDALTAHTSPEDGREHGQTSDQHAEYGL